MKINLETFVKNNISTIEHLALPGYGYPLDIAALREIDSLMRTGLKYTELSDDEHKAYSEIRERLYGILKELEINIHD